MAPSLAKVLVVWNNQVKRPPAGLFSLFIIEFSELFYKNNLIEFSEIHSFILGYVILIVIMRFNVFLFT